LQQLKFKRLAEIFRKVTWYQINRYGRAMKIIEFSLQLIWLEFYFFLGNPTIPFPDKPNEL
jgi:hypothetical protein